MPNHDSHANAPHLIDSHEHNLKNDHVPHLIDSHDHDHDHDHDHSEHTHTHNDNQRLLAIAFALIFTFMWVEIVGGYMTGSLALLSDAGHMFSDAAALGMTLFAFIIGKKAANPQKSFGYKRFEILIAAVNGLTLIFIALLIFYEAIIRLQHPPAIASLQMLMISGVGLVINLIVAKLLHGGDTHNLNMQSAYLHVLTDVFGSMAAIVAALLMMEFGWVWADAVASMIVAVLIFKSGYGVVKNAAHILMEGSPTNLSQDKIVTKLQAHPQVLAVHDVHIWSISSGVDFLSCHVIVDGNLTVGQTDGILAALQQLLQEFGLAHSTIQVESDGHAHHLGFNCDIAKDIKTQNLLGNHHGHSH